MVISGGRCFREHHGGAIPVESENNLAEQYTLFRKIFDYLPDPVLVLNRDYIVEE